MTTSAEPSAGETSRAAQAARTRQHALDTARRLFAEQGYHATSLQQIADVMGVRKANVYYYFPTKAAILDTLLADFARRLEALLDATERLPRCERPVHLVTGFVAAVVEAHRAFGSLNLGDPAMQKDSAVMATLDALGERTAVLLYGETPTTAQRASLWLILDLAPVLRHLGALPDAELRRVLTELCLRVIAAP